MRDCKKCKHYGGHTVLKEQGWIDSGVPIPFPCVKCVRHYFSPPNPLLRDNFKSDELKKGGMEDDFVICHCCGGDTFYSIKGGLKCLNCKILFDPHTKKAIIFESVENSQKSLDLRIKMLETRMKMLEIVTPTREEIQKDLWDRMYLSERDKED